MNEIKEIPPQFRATDGKEFKDKKAAERHQQLIDAKQSYESARRDLGRLLAESQVTADGHPFQFGVFRSFYYLNPGHWSMPSVTEVPYLGWNWDWSIDDSDRFVIRYRDDTRDGRVREFIINELYKDRREADKALLKAREEKLAEYSAEIENERQRLYPSPT